MHSVSGFFARSGIFGALLCGLAACGGTAAPSAATSSAAITLSLAPATVPAEAALASANPAFHAAPVLLDEPVDADPSAPDASARTLAHRQFIAAEFASLPTRRMTAQSIQSARGEITRRLAADSIVPEATGTAIATYTPAQIRAAYGLPPLPAAGTTLTVAQAAQLGAGQTIYIVDANDDPNAAAELAAFNQKFALPACTSKPIAATTALPLPAASTRACEFFVFYTTSAGALTGTAPAYDSGWATEIALDIEWAHATAPLARIVLIEAPDAGLQSLIGGVKLANAMGPGVVSMSFGSPEGSWTASVDSAFTGANMTYVAATGDAGAGVEWPSVSTHVIGVGGTSLTYSGTGARSETAWSGTGGGTSAYTTVPSYQTSAVPGLGSPSNRVVADVAFNADPSTGQYLAVISQGSTAVSWMSGGGTSLATPQWAGLFAIANAMRAASVATPIGAPHGILYGKVAVTPTAYASDFTDVTQGVDGSCATCVAKAGYDPLTGLGTPNATALLPVLANSPPAAPVVTAASVSGTTKVALAFTVAVASVNPVSVALTGAPVGMTATTAGAVTWTSPAKGSYAVTAIATDTKTGLSGKATISVSITDPAPPAVTSATVSGSAGAPLNYQVLITAPHAVSDTLTGAPAGVSIATTGVLSWASPVQGTTKVVVTAKDTTTGLSGQGTITLVIGAAVPPAVTGATVTGIVGSALTFTARVTAANAVTWTLSGAPTGMTVNGNGVVSWPSPVAGTYAVTAIATDSRTGLSGRGSYTVAITPAGPVISATAMTGVAGKPLSGTIGFSDATSNTLSISISGVPAGMAFASGPGSVSVSWASPATGNYSLVIKATDGAGLTASKTVPVTITAR